MKTLWANGQCPKCRDGISFSVTRSEYGDTVFTCNNCSWSGGSELLDWIKVIE